ncbi:MAG: hypothetical protein HJJLKODD_01227 [Phycisphaerae bacterium]|nr:hypothetical protein [Phycisphaerae bacterium]
MDQADASLPPLLDVWSRTAPKYRYRAIILLILNLLLFGGLCSFMFWLRTGTLVPPTYPEYTQLFYNTFNVIGGSQITPQDLLTRPINLKLVPMHAVVVGLLIASLVSIPIVITILYRLPFALPFCAMVGFLAVMPWLGLTLLLSCFIASSWRSKIRFRFAAALLALVPIGIYFFTASWRFDAPVDLLTPQIERGLVVVPLLLSAIASCVTIAAILTIARLVNYRPGAITPVLVLLFLAPWFLFIVKVGRDELHYRLLERHYGPHSRPYFADTNPQAVIHHVARRWWLALEPPRPAIEGLESKVRDYFSIPPAPEDANQIAAAIRAQQQQYLTLFAEEQQNIADECQKFLEDFRDQSRYVPNVLYIKARAQDMRVDLAALHREGLLRFYADFPSPAAQATWTTLVENYPGSPLADVGRYQLALLNGRLGNIDQAIALLQDTERHQQERADAYPLLQEPGLENLLAKKPPEQSLEAEYIDYPLRSAQLLIFLQYNREPTSNDAALVTFLKCDSRDVHYEQNLRDMLQRFTGSGLLDNIELRLIMHEVDPGRRLAGLQALQQKYPQGDCQPELLYEIGLAQLQQEQITEARRSFEQILELFPDSIYASLARRRLPVGRL